jgi:hypothetical protein
MEKVALLESLVEAKRHADQSKANTDAQKRVIALLVQIGKDSAAAERIFLKLERVQNDDLSEMERILNELDDKSL